MEIPAPLDDINIALPFEIQHGMKIGMMVGLFAGFVLGLMMGISAHTKPDDNHLGPNHQMLACP